MHHGYRSRTELPRELKKGQGDGRELILIPQGTGTVGEEGG